MCCLACRLGSFLPGYWYVARSGQSSARQRTASTAGVTPRGVGYLLLVSMGRRGFIGERLLTGLVFLSRLAGVVRFSLPLHVFSADGAGDSSGAGRC